MLAARVEPKNGFGKEETEKEDGVSIHMATVFCVQNGGCSLNRSSCRGS